MSEQLAALRADWDNAYWDNPAPVSLPRLVLFRISTMSLIELACGRWPFLRESCPSFDTIWRCSLLFIGPKGATPKSGNFHRLWKKALASAEVHPALHLHDLRHTGGTMTARTGATLKAIMARLGQSSPRAAMIYQHATVSVTGK